MASEPRPPKRQRRALAALLLILIPALSWPWISLHLEAAGLLLRIFNREQPQWLVAWGRHEIRTSLDPIETDGGRLQARRYSPEGVRRPPGLVVVHGVHHLGMDEPRLKAFARAIASTGIEVLTPEMPELYHYRIRASTLQNIADSAARLAGVLDREQVGVMGISFAGGLALVAANDPELDDAIGLIFALGAHHDLTRLARYYVGRGIEAPDGAAYQGEPHRYGPLLIVHAHTEKLFDARDVPVAKRILQHMLRGHDSGARELMPRLGPEGRRTMRRLLDPDHEQLADELLAAVAEHEDELLAASPRGKLGGVDVPVFLLHGSDDPVIPSVETRWLAHEMPDDALQRALITPLLRHAELHENGNPENGLEPGRAWKLIRFTADLLSTLRD